MNKSHEGLFITLEGGEGAGKSTLAKKLFETLSHEGYSVVSTREPGGTALSERIRDLLLNHKNAFQLGVKAELLLFLAARTQHIDEVILPALQANKIVICDRFNDSSIAYQGGARYLGMSFVEELCHKVCGKLQPDCTLFLDLDPEYGLQRLASERKQDRLENEQLQFHREVRQSFLHLADRHPSRIKIINAMASEQEVFQEAMQYIHPFLKPLLRK